jgi:hypothetical protein
MMQVQCAGCDQHKLVPHSCGHRLCPHCQHHESQQWLERQMQRLVPADYFLLTFTLPAEVARTRRGARRRRLRFADALCLGNGAALQSERPAVAGDAGGDRGPAHALASARLPPACPSRRPRGGGRCGEARWRRKRRGKNGTYLFNEKAMAKVFRAKMLAAIEAAGICLPACYPREWVAHCQSVGSGEKALIYLGRYLYRGVIREQDILACENGRVSFRYRNAKPASRKSARSPASISSG